MYSLIEMLKLAENDKQVGKKNGKWFPHKSPEGGEDTLGYGHKLSKEEYAGNYVTLPDGTIHDFDTDGGLTDKQIEAVFEADLIQHKNKAKVLFNKYAKYDTEFDQLPSLYQDILTELSFNSGLVKGTKWQWPKLVKAMKADDIEAIKNEVRTTYTDPKGVTKVDDRRYALRQQFIDNYSDTEALPANIVPAIQNMTAEDLTNPPKQMSTQASLASSEAISRTMGTIDAMPTRKQREKELMASIEREEEYQLLNDMKSTVADALAGTEDEPESLTDFMISELRGIIESPNPQVEDETDDTVAEQTARLF